MTEAAPRLVIHGAGRMGRLVAEQAAIGGFEVQALVSRQHPGDLGGVTWFPGLDALDGPVDLLIDFTLPGGAVAAARWSAANHVPIVSGTTGLDATERRAFEQAAEVVPVLHAANFSPGLNVLRALLFQASGWLDPNSTALRLVDVHHVHKRDAPSGTALALADSLAPHVVDIESRREGEVVGEHTLVAQLPGEHLVLSHVAEDRTVFARGAVQAGRWLLGRPAGSYDALDVFGGNG